MIVKVQVAIASNDDNPPCLVYDKDMKYMHTIPCTESIRSKVGERMKAYFSAHIGSKGRVIIDWERRAPAQNW